MKNKIKVSKIFEQDWNEDLERRGVFDNPDWVSDCCGAVLEVNTGIEGTSCHICTHCHKPCDVKQLHDVQIMKLKPLKEKVEFKKCGKPLLETRDDGCERKCHPCWIKDYIDNTLQDSWEERWINHIRNIGFRTLKGEDVDANRESINFIRNLLSAQREQICKEIEGYFQEKGFWHLMREHDSQLCITWENLKDKLNQLNQ